MTGFIGGGNMAEAIIKGILRSADSRAQSKADGIMASEPDELRREYLEKTYGIKTTFSNIEIVALCDTIILAVKPQNMPLVLEEIAEDITGEKIIVSIAAGITLEYLQTKLKTRKLVRIMPNTPALVQKGISVMSFGEGFEAEDIFLVREIFLSVGRVLELPEKNMNAVTALSGSGPAFLTLFTEAMIEGGIGMGLSREHASELSVQTFIGTAGLLDSGLQPHKIREMVTSPGGTTAAGLSMLEEKGLKDIVAETLEAAKKRAEDLGRRK